MRQAYFATARITFLAVAFLCTFFGGATAVLAANLSVSPLRVELAPGQTSAVLSLTNSGDTAVVMQLETVSWAQDNGKEVYAPSRDVLASPPVFTLEPGAVQLIRVGLRRAAADPARQGTYRLFLQEVPGALASGKNTVHMALKISLPVFVQPNEMVRKLDWSAQRLADGRVRLRLSNQGNVHVQLSALGLYLAGQGKAVAVVNDMAYVLAGQTREWLLTPNTLLAPSVSVLRVQSGSDSGRIELDVPLQAP